MRVLALKNGSTPSLTLVEGVEYDVRSTDALMLIEKGIVEAVKVVAVKATKPKKEILEDEA